MIILFFVDFSFLTNFFSKCYISAKTFRFQKADNNFLPSKPAHLITFDNFYECHRYPVQSSKTNKML